MTIDVTKMSGPQLVAAYNEKARELNQPEVKRFGDLTAAMKRTAKIYGLPAPELPAREKKASTPKASAPKKAKAPAKAKKAPAAKKTKKAKVEGEIVRAGTHRDKLFNFMNQHVGEYVPISKLMKATYGESHKGLKGPLMMVMKGLRGVIAANRMGLKIEKQRKDKENHFGLFSTKK